MGVFSGLDLVLVFICTLTAGVSAQDSEPQCYSRFDYEYKVLQRLIQLEESHKGLIEKLNDRERENSELRSKIQQLNETVDDMEKSWVVNPGEAQIVGKHIAFTAYIDATTSLSSSPTVFKKISLNAGDAYSLSTGVFTCPVPGVYMFSVVIAVRGSGTTVGEIRVNKDATLHAITEGSKADQDLQGTNMVIVKLIKGDRVWVSGSGSLPANSHGTSNKKTSSFSGFLIYPTHD